MDFSKEIMASIKEGDLAGIQAELIGCLDEDAASHEMPRTLALAEALAEKLPSDLFEEDNGHFDFTSASMDKENLREVKARLRMNFSKEKLDFACKIIASINGSSDSTTTPISEERPIDTLVAVLKPETKPAQEVVAPVLPICSSTPESANTKPVAPSKVSVVEKGVRGPVKMTAEQKVKTNQPSTQMPASEIAKKTVGTSENKEPQMPEKPSAPEPERPSFETKPSTESTMQAPPTRGQAASGQQPTPKRPKGRIMREPGFWESLFGAVGRRMDEFFKRLFG